VLLRGINLVDHEHVGAAQVDLAWIVGKFVAGTMGIDHHNFEIRLVEGRVIVAAVPENHVGFLLRLVQNLLVVHARINHRTLADMRFVLFPLFDRALLQIEVFECCEALNGLHRQVSIRHGMADDDGLPTVFAKLGRDQP
jgi:hypothetical protein